MAAAEDDWSFLGPRVCVVSPWLPSRDGIARYAEPVAALLERSRAVRRVGIPEGGGPRRRALHRGPRALKLLLDAAGSSDILVQYHPHYYMRGPWASRMAGYASWALLVRLRRTSFIVHELDDSRPAEVGRRGVIEFWLEERLRRHFWRGASHLVFLSAWQRGRFLERYPDVRRESLSVTSHSVFTPAARASRAEARRRLGLPRDRVLALMIGFISPGRPDKGYDLALDALARAADPCIDLRIVGSPIREHPEVDALLRRLRQVAAGSQQVHLVERWLTDEEFDLWILAADAVLLPYRESASSGVAERARMLGRRIITTGVGGLAEQLRPDDLLAEDADALSAALRRLVSDAAGPTVEPP